VEIYILRHAEAEIRDGASDRDRSLTDKGREQSRRVARFLRRNELIPDVILSSPFTRAWQTAEIVCDEANLDDPVLADWLGCGMTPETAFKELTVYSRLPDMMIVGHQPDLAELTARLLGLANSDQVQFKKAALIGLELARFAPGAGRLLFSIPVQMMD
jgi:phosphohistidine phosphatase